jgi:hypothetical protein
VATGDLNGDGKLDLVVAENCSESTCTTTPGISILLGNGDGTFATPVSQATSGLYASPSSVLIADLNGDGYPDIAVGNSCASIGCATGSVDIFFNNGDGTFPSSPSLTILSSGMYLNAIAAGDVTGDGIPDLVLVNGCTDSTCVASSVDVVPGTGAGVFGTATTYPTTGVESVAVALADLNGDGAKDIVVANSGGSATVFLSNGSGGFGAASTINASGTNTSGVAIGDVNGDGKLDLALVNACGDSISPCDTSGSVDVFLGQAGGTFASPTTYASAGNGSDAIALADFIHSGALDIVLSDANSGTVSLLLGDGNGKFEAAVSYPANTVPAGLAVGDFNGDGRPDLAVAQYDNAGVVAVLLNDSQPGSTTTTLSATPNPSTYWNPITLTATVTSTSGTPVGSITFADGGVTLGTALLTGGTATISVQTLSVGTHNLTASYVGDDLFAASTGSASETINQAQLPSSMTLTSSQNPTVINTPVTFTATVTSSSGASPVGAISFHAGSYANTVQVSGAGGTASASVSITFATAGHVTVSAVFAGQNFQSSSASLVQLVQGAFKTTTTLAVSPSPAAYGDAETLTATVTSTSGTPDGTVTFADGGVTIGSGTLSGTASLTVAAPGLAAGSHSLTATYSGTSMYAASTGTTGLTVTRAPSSLALVSGQNPSPVGTSVTFTATVSSTSGLTPVGAVSFQAGSYDTTVQLEPGANTASVTIPFTVAGHVTVSAVFAGQDFTNASASLVQVVQAPFKTTTAITLSPTPVVYGNALTITATVTSASGTPNGTVALEDGGVALGTGTLSGGTTSITVAAPGLAAGPHSITATYSGSAQFGGSVGVKNVTVAEAPVTVTLSSSQSPSPAGSSVTYTATVTSSTGIVPEGSVSFSTSSFGQTVETSGGVASVSIPFPTKGNVKVTAVFSGQNFKTQTASMVQVVQ